MVNRIGVNTTTSVQAGRGGTGVPSGRFQVAGITAEGPTGARVVRSMAEYEDRYGARTPAAAHMHDAAALFFAEGGAELAVTRVTGPAARRDQVTLKDRAAVPVATLRVTATAYGTSRLSVRVENDPTMQGAVIVRVLRDDTSVETWRGLTDPAAVVAAAEGSEWVTVTSLGAATVGAAALPAAGTFELAGGTDDRAAVTVQHIAAALIAAGEVAPGGALAAPGYPAEVLRDHLPAVAIRHRQVLLLSAPADADPTEAAQLGQSMKGMDGGDRTGLFYPWVTVQDGARRRSVDPVAFVAAARSRAHVQGYWTVPAGERSRAVSLVGTVTPVDVATNDVLAESSVNGLVTIAGSVRLYGWQSLAAFEDLGLLSTRDTLNGIELEAVRVLEPFLFAQIDGRGHLQSKVEADVEGILAPLARAGALFARVDDAGDEVDPGYQVSVDAAHNRLDTLARHELHVVIAVRLSPLAQLIQVEIVKVPLTAGLS